MSILIFKLIIGPLLIALVTLVTRRWGSAAGGWLAGLPLTSGPISIFLAFEQGTAFAMSSAVTSMVGGVTVAVFSLVYARSAARFSRPISLLSAICGYVGAVVIFSHITFTIPTALLTGAVMLWLCLRLIGPDSPNAPPAIVAPWWDIPLRMAATVAVTFAITALAHIMGPESIGILAPFPAFSGILAVFIHAQNGHESLHRFLRGVITTTYGLLGFFLVVALLLERLSLVATYALAVFVAFGVNIVVLSVTRR
jgi:hypothetical protein